jgi:hypothetical protein
MKLAEHPGYGDYLKDQEIARRLREAVQLWKDSGAPLPVETYALLWSYASAQELFHSLSHLFQQYNRVLWEQFPYCRQCGGQCCGVNAAQISRVDLMALALLDKLLPELSERVDLTDRDCIYDTLGGCGWPDQWRTVKCWLFYCLGSGQWKLSDASGEGYNAITVALGRIIDEGLPDALRKYEEVHADPLTAHLVDPYDFSNVLCQAMDEILVRPIIDRYYKTGGFDRDRPAIQADSLVGDDETLAFIAEAAHRVYDGASFAPPELEITKDQLLADLEQLEWIVLGQPGNSQELLEEMYHRYAHTPSSTLGEYASIWQRMQQQIRLLLVG